MKVYIYGIGGIGTSALARYYHYQGHQVSGSDLVDSEIIQELAEEGIEVQVPYTTADLVVYTSAMKNPPTGALSYPEALGKITEKYKTICVCGTHGKSTVTSMIAEIMIKANLDPTVIVGTKTKEFKNCRLGKSEYLLIEADEYREAFLNYEPWIIVLTGIEWDHPDYYKSLEDNIDAFRKFIEKLPANGKLIANKDDINACKFPAHTFYSQEKIEISLPGKHNQQNASAALTLARELDIPDEVSLNALRSYKGVWRRFQEEKRGDITVIHDYAHHPTALKATLQAVKEKYPNKTIWAIFQPHHHNRTIIFYNNFIEVLKNSPVNRTILTDVYDVPGRSGENIVDTKKMAQEANVDYIPFYEIYQQQWPKDIILLVMGAGDIYKTIKEQK
jgi:UDP-N-acetylmuramate--alanine ligase